MDQMSLTRSATVSAHINVFVKRTNYFSVEDRGSFSARTTSRISTFIGGPRSTGAYPLTGRLGSPAMMSERIDEPS